MYVCGGWVGVVIVRMCRCRLGTTWRNSHKTELQSLNKCHNQTPYYQGIKAKLLYPF